MAAFFYFRSMKLNSALSYYERLISGELVFDINEGFDNYTIQWWNNPDYDSMDFSESGNIFKSYMKIISRSQSNEVGKSLIIEYESAINKEYFAKQCENKIQIVVGELQKKYTTHPCFFEDLIEIFTDFKHNYLISSSDNSVASKPLNKSINKIKWLGKTNVLTTLFYDMLHGQDRRSSLIEATQEDIKDFLMNNFLDADGKEMTLDTVVTYMRPDKVDKRAKIGDRIELGNVKLKNKKV